MKVVILHIIFMFAYMNISMGQDAQFSQLESHASINNPAYTGIIDGRGQLQLSYRDQWSKALDGRGLKRMMATYQQSIKLSDDALSVGISLLGNEVGKAAYRHAQVQLTAAYRLRLSYDRYRNMSQYLSLGFMTSTLQYSLNPEEFWFGSQYDLPNIQINRDISSGESIMTERFQTEFIMDYGVGLRYELHRKDKFHLRAGIAVNHLSTPDISLLDSSVASLSQKWVLNLSSSIFLQDQLFVDPSIWLLSQRESRQAIVGSSFGIAGTDDREMRFSLGAHSRIVRDYDKYNIESLIYSLRLEIESITISFSYDDTIQRLERSDRNFNAFELSLSYRID